MVSEDDGRLGYTTGDVSVEVVKNGDEWECVSWDAHRDEDVSGVVGEAESFDDAVEILVDEMFSMDEPKVASRFEPIKWE
jgi:hypothetical protein